MAKIKDLEANPWRTAEELAESLGISVRSVYRRLDKGRLESIETPSGMRYRNCHFTDVSKRQYVSSTPENNEVTDTLLTSVLTDVFRQLETALERNTDLENERSKLERTAGRAEVLSEIVEKQSETIERLAQDVERWRTAAEREGRQAVTWRARYHVARGRVEMDDE
jgi:predicted transcriptional regulator